MRNFLVSTEEKLLCLLWTFSPVGLRCQSPEWIVRYLCSGVFLRKLKFKTGILNANVWAQVERQWLKFMKLKCSLVKRICILQRELRWFWELGACLRQASELSWKSLNKCTQQPLQRTLKCQNNAFAITGCFWIKTTLEHTDGFFFPPTEVFLH